MSDISVSELKELGFKEAKKSNRCQCDCCKNNTCCEYCCGLDCCVAIDLGEKPTEKELASVREAEEFYRRTTERTQQKEEEKKRSS